VWKDEVDGEKVEVAAFFVFVFSFTEDWEDTLDSVLFRNVVFVNGLSSNGFLKGFLSSTTDESFKTWLDTNHHLCPQTQSH
jgi:hypothetical protein